MNSKNESSELCSFLLAQIYENIIEFQEKLAALPILFLNYWSKGDVIIKQLKLQMRVS